MKWTQGKPARFAALVERKVSTKTSVYGLTSVCTVELCSTGITMLQSTFLTEGSDGAHVKLHPRVRSGVLLREAPAFMRGNTHQAKNSARSSEHALRGIGTFLASIHGTAFHTETHDVKEFLLCERPIHRQDDARRDLLHKMTSLDHTAVRIAPTASNGEPMLHDHGHQFGVDLTEDAHALLAAPAIHLAVLFPQLPSHS